MRNTLRIQDLVQAIRFVTRVIPFARPDDDPHVIVFPRIGDVRQILVRAVEVNVLVVVAIKKIADLESAAKADEVADSIGMTKGDIGRVISTQARATNSHARTRTLASRVIKNVINDYAFEGVVRPHAIGRMNRLIVKAVEIDRVGTIDCDSTAIDEGRARCGQPKIVVLPIVAEGSWEENQRKAPSIAEDEHIEIAAQVRRPPLNMSFIHAVAE